MISLILLLSYGTTENPPEVKKLTNTEKAAVIFGVGLPCAAWLASGVFVGYAVGSPTTTENLPGLNCTQICATPYSCVVQ